jgi:hypothetical protein
LGTRPTRQWDGGNVLAAGFNHRNHRAPGGRRWCRARTAWTRTPRSPYRQRASPRGRCRSAARPSSGVVFCLANPLVLSHGGGGGMHARIRWAVRPGLLPAELLLHLRPKAAPRRQHQLGRCARATARAVLLQRAALFRS